MSIEALCSGSTIIKQNAAHTIGASGGDVVTYSDGTSYDCTVQEMSSQEVAIYDARGERSLFSVYFSEDPGLTVDNRLKLTVWSGVTLSTPKLLRVIGIRRQANPDGDLSLWIIDTEDITQRFED